jgi:hypothetical protein
VNGFHDFWLREINEKKKLNTSSWDIKFSILLEILFRNHFTAISGFRKNLSKIIKII